MDATELGPYEPAQLRAMLQSLVDERVDARLRDPATKAMLAVHGITDADARAFLVERTMRALSAEAGL